MVTRLSFRSALLALTLTSAGTLLTACAPEDNSAEAKWKGWVTQHTADYEAVKGRYDKLAGNAKKITPVGAAAMANDHLSSEMKRVGQTVASLEGVIAKGQDAVAGARQGGGTVTLDEAIDRADKRWQQVYAPIDADLKAVEGEVGTVQKLSEAETKKAAAAAADAAAKQGGGVYDAHRLSHEGGSFDFGDIAFKKGKSEIDTDKAESKAALERLVELFKSCPDFKADLIGHSDKSGDSKKNEKLSEERAQAVRKYLSEKGIKDSQLGKVTGVGGREPLVDEPDPDSDAEKKMDSKALDAARQKNRRITVKVVGTCKLGWSIGEFAPGSGCGAASGFNPRRTSEGIRTSVQALEKPREERGADPPVSERARVATRVHDA